MGCISYNLLRIREQELCICGVGWIEKTTRRKG